MIETSFDITFFIFIVSQYTKNLNYLYIKAVKTILKYIKSCKN